MAFDAGIYPFRQALRLQGALATVEAAIPASVTDPVRIEWDSPNQHVIFGDDLSNFVQDLLAYTTPQMQDLFLLAQSVTAPGGGTYEASLFGFKMALRQQGHLTTIHQAIPADVADLAYIEWTAIDTLVILGDALSNLVASTLSYTTPQMQDLFLLARGYMNLPPPQPGTIFDYDTLVLAVADWLARDDLYPRIPAFIQMFENWWAREAQISDQYVEAIFTPDANGLFTLPADVAHIESLTAGSGQMTWTLAPVTTQYANGLTSGLPTYYRIIGRQVKVIPPGPGSVTLGYYARLSRLSPANQTNWLIAGWPEAYLYGALMQASLYIHDQEGVSFYGQALAGVKDSLSAMDHSKWAGAQMRPPGVCP